MTAPVATPDTAEQTQGTPEVQDQPVQNTAPAVQPDQGQGAGPWANDLAELFPDEGVRNQVDGFLRQKVQPHVTQLEQRGKDLELAGQLYSDLQASPAETYLAITEEIFGPQAAESIRDQLVSLYGEEEDEGGVEEPTDESQGNLPPEVEELLRERREQKEEAAYKQEMDRTVAAHPDVVPELFHPFVAATQGDFETAYTGYARWLEQAKTQFGAQPAEQAEVAPAAIGSDATGTTAPPTEKKYTSIDEALTDTLAEMRAARPAPTVVGSA